MHWHCLEVALFLLASHNTALNTGLVLFHFGSDRRLRRAESYSSGICFITGNLIRFQSSFDSSKVMAKLQNFRVFSYGYKCYENHQSSCRGNFDLTNLGYNLPNGAMILWAR
jgi:hypothetical protein